MKVLQSISVRRPIKDQGQSLNFKDHATLVDFLKIPICGCVKGLITYFCNLSSCEVEGSSANMIVFGKIFWFFSLAFILFLEILYIQCTAVQWKLRKINLGVGVAAYLTPRNRVWPNTSGQSNGVWAQTFRWLDEWENEPLSKRLCVFVLSHQLKF